MSSGKNSGTKEELTADQKAAAEKEAAAKKASLLADITTKAKAAWKKTYEEKAGKDEEKLGTSKTKTGIGALEGATAGSAFALIISPAMLVLAGPIGALIGVAFGIFTPGERKQKAQLDADAKAHEEAFTVAKKGGIKGQELAELAYKKAFSAQKAASFQDQHYVAKGTAVALALMTVLAIIFPPSSILMGLAYAGILSVGVGVGKVIDVRADKAFNDAADQAGKSAFAAFLKAEKISVPEEKEQKHQPETEQYRPKFTDRFSSSAAPSAQGRI
jgi:hypothetical protein